MKKQRLLCVDDDPAMLRLLRSALQAAGYQADVAASGTAALEMARAKTYDLLLVDVVMEGLSGLEVIRLLRQWSDVSIIVISGLGDDQLKVECLDAGADDFLTKPISLEEMRARVRAVLRRSGGLRREVGTRGIVEAGQLRLDMSRREVRVAGERIHLTPTEYQLLCALACHPGRVLTHRRLLQEIWGPQYATEVGYLRNYVRQLRQKLSAGDEEYILTEPGVGYRFCELASDELDSAA